MLAYNLKMMKSKFYRFKVILTVLLMSPAVYAGVSVPNSVQPGYIEKQLTPKPSSSFSDSAISVPQTNAQQIPAEAASVKFVLSKIVIKDNTVKAEKELEKFWIDKIGKEVSLLNIYELAKELTNYYRNAGYLLSQVVVPAQDIENGVVTLQVVEGYIDSIEINDEKGNAIEKPKLINFLNKIKEVKPLTSEVLERQLLLINDLNGIYSRAFLKPSDTFGASKLIVIVNEDKFSGNIGVNNRLSELIGNVQYDLNLNANNLFGLYERNSLRLLSSNNQDLKSISYTGDYPLGNSGLRVSPFVSYSRTTPDIFSLPDLENTSKAGGITLSYPLIRSRVENLQVRGAYSFFNSKTELVGLEIDRFKVRAIRTGLAYDLADKFKGINLFDLEYSHGLKGFGAQDDLNNNGNNLDFNKTSFFASRLQSLAPSLSALLAINGQYSNDILLSSERIGFGGDSFLRAYDPSELLGDSGIAGKLELRYNFNWLNSQFTAYAMAESGHVWIKNFNAADTEDHASTLGAGLRFTVKNINGYLELDKPVGRDVSQDNNRDARVFASLLYSF